MNSELFVLLRDYRVIELNYQYEPLMPVWPTPSTFFRNDVETYAAGEGNYNNLLQLSDYCGTHVDSPAHFAPEGKTIEQIDVTRLMGRSLCIDVSAYPPDTEIITDMIAAWEQAHGEIRARDIVLFLTDYDREWRYRPDHKTVLSDWSGLFTAGAAYLLAKGVGVIGIDAMSLDAWSNHDYPAQRPILGSDNLIMESGQSLSGAGDIHLYRPAVAYQGGLRVTGHSDSAGAKRLTDNTLVAESSRRFVAEV